jgi:phosphohistidine phosphatase
MPKTLVIIRHGKSTWEYTNISDLDRPLKEIGISNTILIAKKLVENKILPDLIISSPANRALHTAMIVARETGYKNENITINTTLYLENEDEILDMIYKTPDNINTLFIFGHNPVFTDIANFFLKNKISNLPTSGCACINFNSNEWSKISPANYILEQCFIPKTLNNE